MPDETLPNTRYLALLLKRRHPEMTHLCEALPCPYCAASTGEKCQTKIGRRTDLPHGARLDAWRAAS